MGFEDWIHFDKQNGVQNYFRITWALYTKNGLCTVHGILYEKWEFAHDKRKIPFLCTNSYFPVQNSSFFCTKLFVFWAKSISVQNLLQFSTELYRKFWTTLYGGRIKKNFYYSYNRNYKSWDGCMYVSLSIRYWTNVQYITLWKSIIYRPTSASTC